MRPHRLLAIGSLATFAFLVACDDSKANFGTFEPSVTGGGGGNSAGGKSAGGETSGDDDDDNGTAGSSIIIPGGDGGGNNTAGTGSSTGSCKPTGPDFDGDGWTVEQGDCNDCDPNVNPGAIDVLNYKKNEKGEATDVLADTQVDEDCSGTATQKDDDLSCDAGLPMAVTDAYDAARAIGLCNVMVDENPSDPKLRKWGVISAGFNSIAGGFLKSKQTPGLQASILPDFGSDTKPREGVNLFGLSTGHARSPSQPDGQTCPGTTENTASSPAAPGFPKQSHCGNGQNPAGGAPRSAMALDLKIRVPTNAKSLRFNFRFFSCEYPEYACDTYNDVFAVIMTPSPIDSGAMYDANTKSANIAFDSNQNVIGVNNADFFTACEPDPYNAPGYNGCTVGSSAKLAGSGFEDNGASAWLATQVNVPKDASGKNVSIIYLRFAIWNAGDSALQSTAMIDNFQWSAEEGSETPVTVIDPPGDIH